jgi:hypothetical protein
MLFSPNYSRIINPDVTLKTLNFSPNIQTVGWVEERNPTINYYKNYGGVGLRFR